MSHVKVSFDIPEYVGNVDGLGTLRILEAVRLLGLENKTKIYQASTSELYGGMLENKNDKGFMMKIPPFIQGHRMMQKFMDFGLLKIIERHIICLHVMEFYSIMNRQGEEKLL